MFALLTKADREQYFSGEIGHRMSALGHKRTFCGAEAMSALPPKADIAVQLGCPLCAISGHYRVYEQPD